MVRLGAMRKSVSILLLVAAGCKSSTDATTDKPAAEMTPIQAFRADHANKGAAMRDALIGGNLPIVRDLAGWMLRSLDDPLVPEEWGTYKLAMKDAAERAAFTVDVDVAAKAIADLAGQCGACHGKLGGPRIGSEPPPQVDGSTASTMLRHRWATGRLWDGLMAPSDVAWKEGAQVLAVAFTTGDNTPTPPSSEEDAARLKKEVHEFGQRGLALSNTDERRVLFGELIARCGQCHELFGKGHR